MYKTIIDKFIMLIVFQNIYAYESDLNEILKLKTTLNSSIEYRNYIHTLYIKNYIITVYVMSFKMFKF